MKDFENFHIAQKIVEDEENMKRSSYIDSISSSSFIKKNLRKAKKKEEKERQRL